MSYIRIKHREMLEEIDNKYNYNIPKDWNVFVNEIASKHHNLIIKQAKDKCICTNCKHEFTTNKKVKEYEKCPNCKNTYMIRRNNLKNYFFENIAVMLDKVDSQLILRLFEIKSNYDSQNSYYGFKVSSVEYARMLLFHDEYTFVNDRVSRGTGPIYIYHCSNPGNWRKYTRYYGLTSKGYVYANNLKEILEDTEYKYSMVWDLAKHIKFFDIQEVLSDAKYSNKVEMLTKAKLYNLAIESRRIYGNGKFENIFGVSKTFYPFMKKYNITIKQLDRLKILKETDIKKIRYLERYSFNALEKICKYISINRFIKYAKMNRSKVDTHMYGDYLKFASLLGFDLKDNLYAFPKDLKKKHDEYMEQYKIKNQEVINNAILKRGKVLSINAYKSKKFIITPASSLDALIDESKQQHNCVRTYAEDYADGECDIYFMRDIKNRKQSLVTVEVQDNEIVQSRTKYNNNPSKQQLKFLQRWEEKVLKGAA